MTSNEFSGYPTKLFVDRPSDDFICGLCLDVLKNPHQCRNGHCFCHGCVSSALAVKKVCPVCKCSMNVNSMSANLLVRNLIEKAEVKCDNAGCMWTGPLHKLNGHSLDCEYHLVLCMNLGCTARLPRKLLDAHIREECLFRKIKCDFCGTTFNFADYSPHLENCELRPIVCRCNTSILKHLLADHLQDDCPMVLCSCPLYYMNCCTADCPKQIMRSQVSEHISVVTQDPQYAHKLAKALMNVVKKCEEATEKLTNLASTATKPQSNPSTESSSGKTTESTQTPSGSTSTRRARATPVSTPTTHNRSPGTGTTPANSSAQRGSSLGFSDTLPFGGGAPAFGGGASPFGGGAPAFGSGASPFGGGAPAFGGGAPAFGSGASPFGGGAPAFGSGASPFGGGAPAFGSGASPFGGGAPAFGGGAPAFGSGASPFGGGAPAFGSGASPFGGGAPAFGSGAQAFGSVSDLV